MRKSISFLASAGLAVMPMLGHAATPTVGEILEASGITEAGYVGVGYDATSLGGNSFHLDQATLTLSRQPTQGVGGAVTVMLGNDATTVNEAYGESAANFAAAQAYLSYATGGLTVIAGRYYTLAGTESFDLTQDANITRSLLFAYVQPHVHTGVRATYKIGDQLSLIGGVNNTAFGVDNAGSDANPQKTIEAGVRYAPLPSLNIAVTEYYEATGSGQGGPTVPPAISPPIYAGEYLGILEAYTGALGTTSLTDVAVTYQALPALSFGLNGDYRRTNHFGGVLGGVETVITKGVALYSSYQFLDQLKGSLRGEIVQLEVGGTSLINRELTYTLDYTVAKNLHLMAEARIDRDSLNGGGQVIVDSNENGRNVQETYSVKALYRF